MFSFFLFAEGGVDAENIGGKKARKKKTEYTLSPLFSLYFSFMSVDYIDTLTALLHLKSVDLRDCYFILFLSRTKHLEW